MTITDDRMTLSRNTGLLAFIYNVYTDAAQADEFKKDPWTIMRRYELKAEEQRVIWSTGLARLDPKNEVAWQRIRAGGTPEEPRSAPGPAGSPVTRIGDLIDTEWANAGAMATLGAMLVQILSEPKPFEETW